MVDELTVVSLLAAPARPAHRAVAALMCERAAIALRFVDGPDWQAQLAMLDTGAAQAAFMCGLIYTWRAHELEPLVAPVQAGGRYVGRPIYYSDLLVRADSPFRGLAELRGARWVSNEPGSLSGHAVMLAHLAELGEPAGFFGSAGESGSHLDSLRMLALGEADVAAIDSTVLELALPADPALARRLRVVATLGPHPAPPFVVSRRLPSELRTRLRNALATLHEDEAGRAALGLAQVVQLTPVVDADYDPVRRLAARAAGVSLI